MIGWTYHCLWGCIRWRRMHEQREYTCRYVCSAKRVRGSGMVASEFASRGGHYVIAVDTY